MVDSAKDVGFSIIKKVRGRVWDDPRWKGTFKEDRNLVRDGLYYPVENIKFIVEQEVKRVLKTEFYN